MADGSVIIDSKLDSSGFEKSLKGLGSIASKGLAVTTKAIGAVSTGLIALGGYATKVGSEFEASMSQVAATMGMSAEEVANGCDEFVMLEEAAKKAGSTTMFSASQSADALNYLALAGYTAEEACTALPKVLDLAAAGGLDLAYASDLVTDSMSALGLSMDELDTFMDQMAKTAQKSNTSVGQLGEATLTLGGTAKTLSGGITEMNTALGILADNGIKGSEGGTALRNVILSLTAGTDTAKEAIEDLGLEVADAEGNMRPLEDIFTDLNKSMQGMGSVAKQDVLNQIFNKVDLKSVSALMAATVVDMTNLNESLNKLGIDSEANADMINYLASTFEVGEDKATFCSYAMQEMGITAEQASGMYDSLTTAIENGSNRFDELSGYISNADDACATMADTMNDNLKGRIIELQSATEGLGIQIYENMENPLKQTAEAGIEAVGQLSEALNSSGFSGMAEAIGSLMAQGIAEIAEYAPQVIQASTTVIQSFIQGISDNLPQIISSAGEIVSSLVNGIITIIPQVGALGIQIVTELYNSIQGNLGTITETGSSVIANLLNGFTENIPQILEKGTDLIVNLANGISEQLPTLVPLALKAIITLAQGIVANLPKIIDAGIKLISSLADGIIASLPMLIETVPKLINDFFAALDEGFVKLIKLGAEIIVKLGKGIIDAIPTIKEHAGEIVMAIINIILHADMLKTGKTLIKNLGEGLKSMVASIRATAKNILSTIQRPFVSGIQAFKHAGGGLIEALGTGAKAMLTSIGRIAKSVLTSLKQPFINGISGFKEIGVNIIKGLINGIKSSLSLITGAIKGVCDSAIKSAKSALGIHSPSKVFEEEVGQYVGQGMAKGIEESSVEASKATTEMCNSVLANGKAFLEKQKAQDKAWSDSKKEQYAAQKQALYDYIERKKEANQLSLEDEKYIYQQLLKAAKGNQQEIEEINKKIVQADEEAYQKRYANSKQYIADKKYFNQMSLQDELAAYERMKDYSKGHAEETKEIEKEIYRVKKEIKEKEIQDVKDANAKILDELKDRIDKEKNIINGKRDAALESLQSELDAIDKAEEERQNNMTIADYETEIAKYQQALLEATDPEEQQKLNEQLFEKQQAYDEWKYQQELKAKKEAIRAQMDEVRAQADEQIATKEDEYEKEKTLLEKQQEAMIQAIQNGQTEMIKSIQEGGVKSLNIQDANAVLAMGINKSLTKDKKDNLNQQYEAVIDNEGKCTQAVEDACVEMYRENYRMGVQMANGIADGILNQTWRAVKAIGMMCDKMIAETQKKLDIHSPSRVFKKMGEYVDQGFGNGIDNGADGVIGSMTDMCTRLKSAVNIDDLVERMSAAVNGEVAVTSNLLTSGVSSSITTNTITNNNTSSTPVTINNYGVPNADDKFGRVIASQVNRELRGRGLK